MKKRITRLAVLQTGKMMAVLYAFFGITMLPFILIGTIGNSGNFFVLFMLLLYPIMGFLGGILMAFLYNITAKWVGGLEVSVEAIESDSPQQT